jgi:2-oxoglutarate ferredoxin oxidoreductase subunit delta
VDKLKKTRIRFDVERCKGCGLCVLFCPKGHLRMSEDFNVQGNPYAEIIDPAACNACGICFRMCPDVVIDISNETSETGAKTSSDSAHLSGK